MAALQLEPGSALKAEYAECVRRWCGPFDSSRRKSLTSPAAAHEEVTCRKRISVGQADAREPIHGSAVFHAKPVEAYGRTAKLKPQTCGPRICAGQPTRAKASTDSDRLRIGEPPPFLTKAKGSAWAEQMTPACLAQDRPAAQLPVHDASLVSSTAGQPAAKEALRTAPESTLVTAAPDNALPVVNEMTDENRASKLIHGGRGATAPQHSRFDGSEIGLSGIRTELCAVDSGKKEAVGRFELAGSTDQGRTGTSLNERAAVDFAVGTEVLAGSNFAAARTEGVVGGNSRTTGHTRLRADIADPARSKATVKGAQSAPLGPAAEAASAARLPDGSDVNAAHKQSGAGSGPLVGEELLTQSDISMKAHFSLASDVVLSAPETGLGSGRMMTATLKPELSQHAAEAAGTSATSSDLGDAKTLRATSNVLEVGLTGGPHGWLRVRAELGHTGEVTASLVASNPSAATSLKKEPWSHFGLPAK